MAKTSWLNDNEYRDYPFIEGVEPALPESVIVDGGVTLGPSVEFNPREHQVYLAKIQRSGDIFSFVFQSNAPALLGKELIFIATKDEPTYACVRATETWEDVSESNFEFSWSYCGDPVDWDGFLVLGRSETLQNLLNTNGTILLHAPLEPARIVSLHKSILSSLRVVNTDRTRAKAPPDCPPLAWNPAVAPIIFSGCMEGPIKFVEGYNCRIEVDPAENVITINAVNPTTNESFAGPPLEEVPLFPGEAPPVGRTRLDGALDCSEVFRTINGIPGPVVEIVNGPGVSLKQNTETHTLTLHVHMVDMAVCPEDNVGPQNENGCPDFDPCEEET